MTRAETAALESEAPPGLGGRAAVRSEPSEPPASTQPGGGGPDLVPWIVTTGVLAGVLVGIAIPVRIVSEDRYAYFVGEGCLREDRPGCATVYDEADVTLDASTTLFIGSGLFAATAITLGIVQAVTGAGSAQSNRPEPSARVTCAPGWLGGACRVDF